jgi:myo-inositol-1(or 4)-monophosphatase
MTSPVPTALETLAAAAARAGGAELARLFGSTTLEVRAKGKNDFVTQADHASEAAVVATLRAAFPDHAILTEESGLLAGRDDAVEWIVDPLDGTTNFLQGLPIWSVSVGCRHRGELVAGAIFEPLSGRLFSAARGAGARLDGRPIAVSARPAMAGAFLATGFPFRAHSAIDRYLGAFREVFQAAGAIRRCGSAALDLAYTACGVYDGFFEFRLSAWDIAAGALLITEAGGVITDLDGGAGFLESGNVVAGNRPVQRELLATVARHADEGTLALLPAGGSGPG